MIDCVLKMKVGTVHFDLQALSTPPSMFQVYRRMPQVANQSYAKAAQLFLCSADWDDALKEAAIPDTELARSSVRRTIRELMAEAKAEAEAAKAKAETEAAKAKAEAKWSSAREPPWVVQVGAVGGQVRPSGAAAAPLRPRFLVQRDQEAPRSSPWALFRARRRRWARKGGGG